MRGLIEDYYDIQMLRLAIEGRLRAYDMDVSEQEMVLYKKLIHERLFDIEREIYDVVNNDVEAMEIWRKWLKDVKGVGPVIASAFHYWIGDIEKFATISKLWRYSGMAVFDGRAEKKKKGTKLHYNPRLKVVCWKFGESIVKSKGGYRDLYDEFRDDYNAKWKTPEDCGSPICKSKNKCFDKHKFMAAKRKTTKVFLAHYWQKSRELKGLSIDNPFIIGRNGHEHVIPIIAN